MMMQIFDEIDEDQILEEELEGFEDELEELGSHDEDDDHEEVKTKRRSMYDEPEEDIDDSEKRRIMSNGINMP